MQHSKPMARGTVLVVSNAPELASGLVGELRRARIEVLRTARCIEAIALAAVVAPELVVVDASLDGAQALCRQLAESGRSGQALLVLAPEGRDVHAPLGCEVVALDATAWETVLRRAEALVAEGRDLRAASPLTGLPGNAAIRLELERRFASGRPVALVYADIDGFKPFNDHYGFLRGDEVLRAVAQMLDREAGRRPDTFVGHVGGDDFVLLTAPDDAEAIAADVVAAFDAAAPGFYDPEDAGRGYLEAEDRQGQPVAWPLLSLSVGVATTAQREVRDPLALVDVATEMKHVAKQRGGSAVAVDRRVDTQTIPSRRRRLHLRAWGMRASAAVAVVVFMALPGVGVAAASAAPGDRLWPASRLAQDARLAVAGDGRAALHADLAAARLTDLVTALTAGDERRTNLAAFEFARHARAAGDDPAAAKRLTQPAVVLERLEASACGEALQVACGAVVLAARAANAASGGSAAAPPGGGSKERERSGRGSSAQQVGPDAAEGLRGQAVGPASDLAPDTRAGQAPGGRSADASDGDAGRAGAGAVSGEDSRPGAGAGRSDPRGSDRPPGDSASRDAVTGTDGAAVEAGGAAGSRSTRPPATGGDGGSGKSAGDGESAGAAGQLGGQFGDGAGGKSGERNRGRR